MKPQPTAQPQMKASDGTPPSLLVRLRRQVRQSSAGSWRLAKSLRRPAFRATICALLLPSLCLPLSTYANPSGGQVVAGAATISGSGSHLTITQGSHRAIINWQDFSIGAGQTTSFVQPSATSAALNRVLGGNPSAIHGQLNATGQVYLINPNGVLVGPGGVVNTAGFLASTLDVSDDDFLRGGDMTFKGASNAAVINLGSITAAEGDVILIARQVENHGDIDAPQGTVGLGAGSEVLLKAGGEERMFVRPESGGSSSQVNQAGKIRAATVELKAAGGNEYSLAIKHSGETRATGVSKRGGRVYLSAGGKGGIVNTGRITARKSSGRGGIVRVEADKVTLGAGSRIDVSGTNGKGGGEVLVGGGYQGKDTTIRNASRVDAEVGSLIIADGDGPGNGGRVILWSDERTGFGGEILARGGTGGFVEISGKSLNFNGNVNTGGGTLLLDPVNLTIVSGNVGSVGDDSLGDGVITGLLGSNSLILTAGNQIALNGDVNINWSQNTTLTLDAGTNILIKSGAVIENTNTGANFNAIVLNAQGLNSTAGTSGVHAEHSTRIETHSGTTS